MANDILYDQSGTSALGDGHLTYDRLQRVVSCGAASGKYVFIRMVPGKGG